MRWWLLAKSWFNPYWIPLIFTSSLQWNTTIFCKSMASSHWRTFLAHVWPLLFSNGIHHPQVEKWVVETMKAWAVFMGGSWLPYEKMIVQTDFHQQSSIIWIVNYCHPSLSSTEKSWLKKPALHGEPTGASGSTSIVVVRDLSRPRVRPDWEHLGTSRFFW